MRSICSFAMLGLYQVLFRVSVFVYFSISIFAEYVDVNCWLRHIL